MKTLWTAAARDELRGRLSRLTPEAERRWGHMSAPQMVAHLVDSLRMASGELPVASKNLPIRFPPLKQLIVYWAPFPKGAPTAPELVARTPGPWAEECATLCAYIEAFSAGMEARRAWPEHPAFGRLTPRAWGVLAYRHIDHHFRQFGV